MPFDKKRTVSMFDERTALGWTQNLEVRALLAPFIPANQWTSLTQFEELTAAALTDLLRVAPRWLKNERQNGSPTMGEFELLGRLYPGMTYFGYVVGPDRNDERVSIEGCYLPETDLDEELRGVLSEADEWDLTDGRWRAGWD